MTKRVTGLGGIFFKANDVQALREWYRDHLGFNITEWGATFSWGDADETKKGWSRTEWSPFKSDSTYLGDYPYMFNYRVHDLDQLLEQLSKEGVTIDPKRDNADYGKFAWIIDPEGRRIELWEPVDDQPGDTPPVWDQRVTGVGGVFFKSKDPKAMKAWYAEHLGVSESSFLWVDLNTPEAGATACTVWAPFPESTNYFAPSEKQYMFNYRVKDLTALLETLKAEGVQIVGTPEEYDYGKFGWIMDPEGNKIELWEPKG